MKLFPIILLFAAFAMPSLKGQSAEEVQVKIKGVKTQALPSPEFAVSSGGALKRWKAKEWLEVDVEFDVKLAQSAGGRDGVLDAVQVNVYIALEATDENSKRYVLKASQNFVRASGSEESHVLFFVSPASLKSVLRKDNFLPTSDVKGWGVEISVGGKVVAADSSLGQKAWWQDSAAISLLDGILLTKNKTPFAPLWHDYDLETANP